MLTTALHDELDLKAPALASGFRLADLSRWQSQVDIAAYKPGAVILRTGGADGGRYIDADWAQRSAAFRRAGKQVAGYWFNGGSSSTGDADFLISQAAFVSGEYVIADIEGEDGVPGTPWSPAQADDWVDEVKSKAPHLKPMVYMSAALTREHDWSGLVKRGVHLYVASYGANDGSVPSGQPLISCWPTWDIWQYTSLGTIGGIDGKIDLDYAKNTVWPTSPAPEPAPAPAPKPTTVYVVKSGDTLSSIAAHFHTTWQAIYALNKGVIGASPDHIHPGERLRLP